MLTVINGLCSKDFRRFNWAKDLSRHAMDATNTIQFAAGACSISAEFLQWIECGCYCFTTSTYPIRHWFDPCPRPDKFDCATPSVDTSANSCITEDRKHCLMWLESFQWSNCRHERGRIRACHFEPDGSQARGNVLYPSLANYFITLTFSTSSVDHR